MFDSIQHELLSGLSERDALVFIATCGVASHIVFKRYEPQSLYVLFGLLILAPITLSAILLGIYSNVALRALVSFSVYLSALVTSVLLYRVSPWHPLAKYPGPFMNKLSMIYPLWRGLDGKNYMHTHEIHRKYGDIVRIGPNKLSINDASIVAPLYSTQGLPKGQPADGQRMGDKVGSLVLMRDQQEHAQRRIKWQRGLNTNAVKEYEPLISRRVRQLVDKLESSDKQTVDLSQLLSYFSYDFMADMGFGGGSEMLENGDVDGLWALLEQGVFNAYFMSSLPWLVSLLPLFPGFKNKMRGFKTFAMGAASRRKAQGSMNKDLFYHLIDEGGVDKEPPSMAHVMSDGALVIVAGSDTTANTLSNLFYFLMTTPAAYERLQREIDQFYPNGEDGTESKSHVDMPYLTACINESLRLFPVVPDGSQRGSTKQTGARLLGPYYIPEGTLLGCHTFSIQRDARNFYPAPEVFWPERWLIADGVESAPADFKHNYAAFFPFSTGPANCVGKYLAMQEMRTLVCAVLQRVGFEFAQGYDSTRRLDELQQFLLIKKAALPVVVRKRN